MIRFSIGLLMLIMVYTVMVLGAPADAHVYKWVDENGVTRFSDRPPPGVQEAVPPSDAAEPNKASRPDTPESLVTNLNFDLSNVQNITFFPHQ